MEKQSGLTVAACVLFIAAAAGVMQAQTYSVVYNFGTNVGDPYTPFYSGIIAQGTDGNLYSATESGGGAPLYGAAFGASPTTSGSLLMVSSFTGAPAGAYPYGDLTLGTDGNFYGTTTGGGSDNGPGTIFMMSPGGGVTTLYNFTGGSDGACPYAPPVEGADGNFYGTTQGYCAEYTSSSIYKITPPPSATFTPLYSFNTSGGYAPIASLLLGTDGNFYGTTFFGGTGGAGEVFKITPAGELTVLHSFDGKDGDRPAGS